MSFELPIYHLPIEIINQIEEELEKILSQLASQIPDITYRPIRPEELNTGLTIATRTYVTTLTGPGTWDRLLNASTDPVVPAGNYYVFMGWFVVDDPNNSIGLDCIGRIYISTVLSDETLLSLVNLQENNLYLKLKNIILIKPNTTFSIQVTGAAGGVAIIYPFGFRFGPKEQLNPS